MSYENHNENECDKCLENLGKDNLIPVPFLYLDMNDRHHPVASDWMGKPFHNGYRQYSICKDCEEKRKIIEFRKDEYIFEEI